MLRRLAAVALLTMASLMFAARFIPPPTETDDIVEVLATIEIEIETTTTHRTFAPLPEVTTTTKPPLPPGIQQFESGFVRFNRGLMQLRITLDIGVLVDVEMVRVPSRSERARTTNLEAAPVLTAEAIEVQDYRLHVISGATETSYMFMRALRDAFDQAEFCTGNKCDLPFLLK
jgi:uncharacterized protein with FMN-binding domain